MGFKQHHFVLVHGAGHGAWCWVKIVPALEKAGHRVTAIDLASAGEDTRAPESITSLEQYDQPLEDLLASFPDEEKVILVGHSLGGFSLTRMSELFPRKIAAAVYLSAFMPGPGQNTNELRASDPKFWKLDFKLLHHSDVEGGKSVEFPLETLRDILYNKCSPEDFAFAADRVKRFPAINALFESVALTEENYGSVPKVFVSAIHDKNQDLYTVRKSIKLNPPNEVYEIDADHSSFFSGVEVLEQILLNTAAKY